MANFNKVMLMGNLTRDPELRYLQSGTAVCDFGIAVNRRFTRASGEKGEETLFISVTAFGRQAEVVSEFMQKGRPIFIEGRLKFDQWTGQDGQKRSKHGVVLERFQFLDFRGGGGGAGPSGGGAGPSGGGRAQGGGPQQEQQRPRQEQEQQPPGGDDFDTGDDSIPF